MSTNDTMKIRILMLQKGITNAKLAKRFKVSRPAISMALSGERKSLLEKIVAYVKAA